MDELRTKKMNLMQTGQTLSSVKFNSVYMKASNAGASEIARHVKADGGVDGIEAANERLEDTLEDAREVLGASARAIGEAADLDDDELLEELEQELRVADAAKLAAVNLNPTSACGAGSKDVHSLF